MDNTFENKQEIISKIMLINADDDKEIILKVLNETDISILKYLTSITVHDSEKVPESIAKIKTAYGALTSSIRKETLIESKIDIVSSKFRPSKGHFKWTLYHEIGHIWGHMNSSYYGNSENFANNYADDPIKTFNYKETVFDKIKKFIIKTTGIKIVK